MQSIGAVFAELFPRSSRTPTQLATLAVLFLLSGVLATSTVAVAASPACEQLVHSYVDRLVRNVVSPATLRRWREWGVRHPNWHPSAQAHARPKFKKVREDKVSRMQLACNIVTDEIALLPANLDNFFLPAEKPSFEQAAVTPVSAPLQAFQAPLGGTPTILGGPVGGGIGTPGIPSTPGSPGSPVSPGSPTQPISVPVPITPAEPVIPAPVPEPGSVVLTLTGMAAIAAFSCFHRKRGQSRLSA